MVVGQEGEPAYGLDGYYEHLVGRGLSTKTINTYMAYVTHADQWMHRHNTSLAWCAPSHIAEYAASHIAPSHSSRGQAAAAFRHYWDYTARTNPPVKAVRVPPQPEMVCRAVTEDEARALTKTALGWYPQGLAVLFGLYLALRRSEIAAAEWERFNTDLSWYRVTGKFDKTATLPVHSNLRSELEARRDVGWVFPGRFGGHVADATIWDWSKQVASEAGLTEFTTHQLRHTALTTANDNLGDLRAVQTFARHQKPETTAGYTRTKQTRLRDVSDSLDYL